MIMNEITEVSLLQPQSCSISRDRKRTYIIF